MLREYVDSLERSYPYSESIRGRRVSGGLFLACSYEAKLVFGSVARMFGDKKMAENDSATNKSGGDSETKPAEPRSPRSIRFSDSEWAGIENEAKARGMSAAELVRHAAVNFAAGKLMPNSIAFPREIGAQIERIYRGVYLLSTLKRDEMVRDGRHEELKQVAKDASDSQTSIRKEALRSINSCS